MITRTKYSLLISFIFFLISSSNKFIDIFQLYDYSISMQLREAIPFLFFSIFFGFFFFYFIIYNRKFALVVLPIIFGLGYAVNYTYYVSRVVIDKDVIGSVFEASYREFTYFVTPAFFVLLAFSIIIALWLAHFSIKVKKNYVRDRKILFLSIVFSISAIMFYDSGSIVQTEPVKTLGSIKQFLRSEDIKYDNFAFENNEYYIGENQYSRIPKSSYKPKYVFLVIGESSRADHWQLNGYNRNTNPVLGKTKNIISFDNAYSCSALTRVSVPCIISNYEPNKITDPQSFITLIRVFKQLGYKTHWLDTQSTESFVDSTFIDIARKSDYHYFLNKHMFQETLFDGDMIPIIDGIVNSDGNHFVIVHTSTGHWPYQKSYPRDFKTFKPVCENTSLMSDMFFQTSSMKDCFKEDKQKFINSYDNTILYIDHFLGELINRIKHENSFLVYSSDHGESLGENGFFLHGRTDRQEQKHIGFLVWYSDLYKDQNPKKAQNIKKNRNALISHSYIFHSLIDCLNFNSNFLEAKKSICNYDMDIHKNN